MTQNSNTMKNTPTFDHTYKRYRLGLEAVVQWLIINAESCGYSKYNPTPSIITPSIKKDTKKKKSKSKSKSKSKAKDQTQEDTKSETPTAKEITVSPKEYIALAKAISASRETQIHVPAWVLHQLSDMIAVRRFFAERFTSSVTKDSTTSDIPSQPPSQDIISVLNEVLQLLSSLPRKADSNIPSYLYMVSDQFHKYTSGLVGNPLNIAQISANHV